MLPAVISREIEQGIKSFLRTTFPSATPVFARTLESLLDDPGSVFKGPYYQLRLPFRPSPSERLPFAHIHFPYRPHLHQARAFSRLCQDPPLSTLVATGTGSGKTECFLYPILEHCAACANEPGIKAILIYPMNALATDQARRVAEAIHTDPALRDKVTAGLFIGGESDQSTAMKPDWLITHKDRMREHPPDILLTNYKMLDFLLLRPEEQRLWRDNGPHTLRYLVVDELHSFDGAQSTDLACLIRRLKARLRTPENHLCCVGTSATLGSRGAEAPLVEYAQTVFHEPFAGDAVIGEELLDLSNLVSGLFIRHHDIPDPDDPAMDASEAKGKPEAYLKHQHRLWFEAEPPNAYMDEDARLQLGDLLREHSFFRNVLMLVEGSGQRVWAEDWLLHELGRLDPRLVDASKAKKILDSFFSLCAHARYRNPQSGSVGPLVWLRIHLWTRELSRMVATVEANPKLVFSDDLNAQAGAGKVQAKHLPVMHCRECGAMGWGGTMRAMAEKVFTGLQDFYRAYFGRQPTLRFFFPQDAATCGEEHARLLCGDCLTVNRKEVKKCVGCGGIDNLVEVAAYGRTQRRDDHTEADAACPYCGSASGLTILGSRSASLTSVALGQLYASPFNRDKRALAFSDSVQDASHRAGFFAARTYRVNLRRAIRRMLVSTDENPTLAGFAQGFLQHWRKQLGDNDFVGLFLAPNMEWLRDYETLQREGELPADSDLVSRVERRTSWEITAEFGFSCRIGRTLEKSGAAIAYPSPDALARAAENLARILPEHAGGFKAVSTDAAKRLLAGLLHRLRTSGGIRHPELDEYMSQGGNTWLLNRREHMPSFSDRLRAPAFFYLGPDRFSRFERVIGGGTSLSWCQRWAMKVLADCGDINAEAAGMALEEAVKALIAAGLLEETPVRSSRVWGLPPKALLLSRDVSQITCGHCGHSISCAPAEEEFWIGAPCVRPSCEGHYHGRTNTEDYFGELYRSGDILRIRPAEHTGLLDRESREWIERRFMTQPPERRTTDPNLLSCTPTLEMGVNIGDLSSVVLCAVPPACANYVQRVGRAGRTKGAEGVAFNLTIAAAKPHDLYYFEKPEDMIAGEILPPGTFLDAPAVLERQLTAFCLDRWSEQSDQDPVLPHKLDVVLDAVRDPDKHRGFPFDFFAFVEENMDALVDAFLKLFGEDELAAESKNALARFAKGDSDGRIGVSTRILTRMSGLERERRDLRERLKKVGGAIRRNRRIKAHDEALDEELDELKQHRDGINGMLKQINGKLTLNFLTDEGLLPNYMFPEEAVELRSVILRKPPRQREDQSKFETLSFEYVRPAASAITELAPGNVFYVEGRKLKIDQVGLGVSPVEKWHFCDRCGHMERVSDASPEREACPQCGSRNWADSFLIHDLIRLRQVVSTMLDRKSRTQDDRDERERGFFARHECVLDSENIAREAFEVKGSHVPFGFEFLQKVTLRVVNLGEEGGGSQSFRIAGRQVSTDGFILCPECGKVQNSRDAGNGKPMRHDIACRHYKNPDSAPLRAVFLYREITSEAIRVLLPSSGPSENMQMASFVAALHLGLRLHFRGSIEHLRSVVDERPVRDSDMRRKYLVIYDQVPGGTGYLKQLSRSPDTFIEVLRKAADHLRACDCANRQDHSTDGCHRCILHAPQNRDHSTLSRMAAIWMLDSILQNAGDIKRIHRISEIDIHPLIQSELERNFLESLRGLPGAQLLGSVVRGKPGFLWRRGDNAWHLVPQVPVTSAEGVEATSTPDFILYPVRESASRPVAVFLDGYAYHADEAAGNNRIAKDIRQRQALTDSGRYHVWSFSWEDIHFRNEPSKVNATPFGEANAERRNNMARSLLGGNDLERALQAGRSGNWELFLGFLDNPEQDYWVKLSYLYAMALPGQVFQTDPDSTTETVDAIARHEPVADDSISKEGDAYGGLINEADGCLRGVTVATAEGIRQRSAEAVFTLLALDDEDFVETEDFPNHWRGWFRLLNRLQFLPGLRLTTKRGYRQGLFSGISENYRNFLAGDRHKGVGKTDLASTAASKTGAEELEALIELVDSVLHPLLRELASGGHHLPEIGFELVDGGRIMATAEAAWEDPKLALLPEHAADDSRHFKAAGWKVIHFSESQPPDPLAVLEHIHPTPSP